MLSKVLAAVLAPESEKRSVVSLSVLAILIFIDPCLSLTVWEWIQVMILKRLVRFSRSPMGIGILRTLCAVPFGKAVLMGSVNVLGYVFNLRPNQSAQH